MPDNRKQNLLPPPSGECAFSKSICHNHRRENSCPKEQDFGNKSVDIVKGKSAGRSQKLEQGSKKLCKISVLENRSQDTLVMVVPANDLGTETNGKKPSHRTPWPSSV